MITKTTNLDSAYNSLFDEIRTRSHNSIDIDNIEGFFGNIERIAKLGNEFLRLPLDEPMFEINANTRTISVPADFRTNGISVQGDHLAETVFFSIDRYFDYVDLSSTDISINWKMGNVTGRTKNFIMSKEILPGRVVFGWPINNIITEKSGQLTFAVEFRKERDGKVVYNFNTLAANVTIKDGLVIDGDIEAIALDNDILSILTNSAFGTGDAAVADVTWVSGNGLVKNASLENEVFIPADFEQTLNLLTVINEEGQPESMPITVYAEGYVDNTTEIRYSNPKDLEQDVTTYLAIPDYEDGVELPTNHKFYKKVSEGGVDSYIPATATDIANWNAEQEDERITLYIRLASLRITKAGNYIIKAQGEKYSNGSLIGAGDSSLTETITIPEAKSPNEIIITTNPVEDTDSENYSFDPTISNVVFLNQDEEGVLVATVDEAVNDIGALQFIWQKKIGEAINFTDIDAINDFTLNNKSIKNINAEGQYKVLVKNFKNGTEAPVAKSDIWTASLMATPIISATCTRNGVIAKDREDFNSQDNSMARRQCVLTISEIDRGENPRGIIEYGWKRGDTILEKETSDSISTNIEGEYTPIIRNVYNGSIYTKELPPIFVNDIANDQ